MTAVLLKWALPFLAFLAFFALRGASKLRAQRRANYLTDND